MLGAGAIPRARLWAIGTRPLLVYSLACLIIGFQMLAIGFLGELVAYKNFRNENKYSIAEFTPPSQVNPR